MPNQIQIVTRAKKRCAPNCGLHCQGRCMMGLSPNGVAVGPDCPKDGLWDVIFTRHGKTPSGDIEVRANIKGK